MGARYLTEEQKKLFKERRNKTMMERYGCLSMTDVDKVKKTKLDRYGDENYNNMQKHENTCIERYGVNHHNKCKDISKKISDSKKTKETQEKYENTMIQRYGNKSVLLILEFKQKYQNTLMKNYGVLNPLKNKEIYDKHIKTMRKNGSFKKSKIEEEYYSKLVEKYGKEDVFRQYSDERYPFNCDFYVKSEDLFIEVNYHPAHNFHPFDESNDDDIKLLESFRKKNTNWYNTVIDVWTNRDVMKLNCAKKNNLNYIAVYPNDLVIKL